MEKASATQIARGIDRRVFLRNSGVALSACALPHVLASRAQAGVSAPARQAIIIFLQGGLSHLDSWDLKPEAPAEFRGEFQPIATSVPGFEISEHMPRLAQRAAQYNVLRSVYHGTPSHEAAIHWTLTGYD